MYVEKSEELKQGAEKWEWRQTNHQIRHSSQEPLELLKIILAPRELSDIEEMVFLHTWNGKMYREMAQETQYQEGYLKDIGSQLWLCLSDKLGCQVTKKNLRLILKQNYHLTRLNFDKHYQFPDACQKLEFPGSPLPFGSDLYIKRSPIEDLAIATISQAGSLIRIQAPSGMGKTSLINHLMGSANQMGMQTVFVDVQQADTEVLSNLDLFLRWFCCNIGRQLDLEPKFDDYWFEDAGSKLSCTTYIQEYILNQLQQPILVAIDKVHYLVDYPNLANNFFPLLRSWYEQARVRKDWQKLRLIIANSGELDLPIQFHQSPFNVGLPLLLPDLTTTQLQDLADRYQLHTVGIKDYQSLEPLFNLIGGHPYLLNLAFYWLRSGYFSLARLLEEAPTDKGIYGDHLRRQRSILQRNNNLIKAFYQVLLTPESVEMEMSTAYELESMGLVKLNGQKVSIKYELYRQYFSILAGGLNS
ncbi:AAA-like domain-containing protein [Anabaena sp. UHCC 0451]|uniref:AAA-like domain-containing protein n=1 Tax=Anabaena sp. UHCC 0451 TaxID=2055235 RepID=UPI002B1F0B68|nr:AAA-like domain-containing protein [Anabaena sp. UHCC 0451]MEA5575697.1 AAA-like domain-containing protein [Anabaena sp. UHCC 0451]